MSLLRFLFMPEFDRPLRSAKASAGRSGRWLEMLWPGRDARQAGPGRRGPGRTPVAAVLGAAALAIVAVAMAGGGAFAQSIDSSLFAVVDRASRDLVGFLRGEGSESVAAYAALGDMVWYFTAGILVFAAVLFVYHLVAEVMDAGWEGRLRIRGREVVRIVAAVALLWPLPGGPSGGQHIVVDLAGLGGDFAQAVWKPFAGTILGSSAVSPPKPSERGREAMMVDFLVVEVCRELAGRRLDAGPVIETVRGGSVWRYDVARGSRGYDLRSNCGEVRFAGLDLDGPRGAVAKAHLEGMKAARDVIAPAARTIAEPYEEGVRFGDPMDPGKVSGAVAQAVAAYAAVVNAAVQDASAAHNAAMVEDLRREEAEEKSWVTAGSLFNRVAERIGAFNWSVVSGPEVTPPMLAIRDKDRKTFKALFQIREDITAAVGTPGSEIGSRAPGAGSSGGGIGGSLGQFMYSAFFTFENVLDVEGDNPIVELAAIGHNLIDAVLGAAGLLMGSAVVSNLADASVLGTSSKADLFEATWPVIDGLVTMVFMVLLIAGAVLAWLVPALPFIRFLFGLLVWILAVVEAFIAITVWLAAQTARTDEGGLLTNTTVAGLVTLAGVVLRPPLMILGLVIGYLVFQVAIDLFNDIWLTQMKVSTGEDGPGLIRYAAFVALYVMIAYALLNASLKLIDMLPDAAMSWIGGRAAGASGADQMIGVATGAAGRFGGAGPRRAGRAAGASGGRFFRGE